MNKGTPEGTIEEIKFVKLLNKKSNNGFWNILKLDPKDKYAIHVISHQLARINCALIKPKADIFIAKGNVAEEELIKNNFYLDEKDIGKYDLVPIEKTGISVKRPDSTKYQILKMNPSTFKKVFGNLELGAGASIYCTKADELNKNDSVLKGWKTTWKKFKEFFSEIEEIETLDNNNIKSEMRLSIAKKIKTLSNKIIEEKINQDENISKFVFQGIGNLEEPYTAHWLYELGKLKIAGKIAFVVTTGSGRSRGDFTIVIKPK